MRSRPTIVVPAAGLGLRFGGPLHKLKQPFGDDTVLGRTLRNAVESGLPVVLVTTESLAPLAAGYLDADDVVVLTREQAAFGMGHTISAGVALCSDAPGWLVLPADMPLVRPSTMAAVADALDDHPVAYAQYRGRRGHPVGFAAELYSELVVLRGENGARRVIARYPAHGQEVDDAGVLLDIDTAADLDALRQVHATAALPAGS